MIGPVGTSTTAITKANSEVYSASSKASLRATAEDSYKDRVWIALGSARKLEAEIKKAQASLQDCKNLAWNNLLEPKWALQRNLEKLDVLLSSSTSDFDRETYKKEWYDCQGSYVQLYKHLEKIETEVGKFNFKPNEDLLRLKQEESLHPIVKETSKLGLAILMLEPKPVYAFGAMDVMASTRLVKSSAVQPALLVQLINGFATYPKNAALVIERNDTRIESLAISSAIDQTASVKLEQHLATSARAPDIIPVGEERVEQIEREINDQQEDAIGVEQITQENTRDGAVHFIAANGYAGKAPMLQTMFFANRSFDTTAVSPISPSSPRDNEQDKVTSSEGLDSGIDLFSSEGEADVVQKTADTPMRRSRTLSQNSRFPRKRTVSSATVPKIVVTEDSDPEIQAESYFGSRRAKSRALSSQSSATGNVGAADQQTVTSTDAAAENLTSGANTSSSYLSATQASSLASSHLSANESSTLTRGRARTLSHNSPFSRGRTPSSIRNRELSASQAEVDRLKTELRVEKERTAQLAEAQAEVAQLQAELQRAKTENAAAAQAKNLERLAQPKAELQESGNELDALKSTLSVSQLEAYAEETDAAFRRIKEKLGERIKPDIEGSALLETNESALTEDQESIVQSEAELSDEEIEENVSHSALSSQEEMQPETESFWDDLIKEEKAVREGIEALIGEIDRITQTQAQESIVQSATEISDLDEKSVAYSAPSITQEEAEQSEIDSDQERLNRLIEKESLSRLMEEADLLGLYALAVQMPDTWNEQNLDYFFQLLEKKFAIERDYLKMKNQVGRLNEEEWRLGTTLTISAAVIKAYNWIKVRGLNTESLAAVEHQLADLNPQVLEKRLEVRALQANFKKREKSEIDNLDELKKLGAAQNILLKFNNALLEKKRLEHQLIRAEKGRMQKLKDSKKEVEQLLTQDPSDHWRGILELCTYIEEVFQRKKIEQLQQEIQARLNVLEENYYSMQASDAESRKVLSKINKEGGSLQQLLSVQNELKKQQSVQDSIAGKLNEISVRLEELEKLQAVDIEIIDAYEKQLESLWDKNKELYWARQGLFDAADKQFEYFVQDKDIAYPPLVMGPISNREGRRG